MGKTAKRPVEAFEGALDSQAPWRPLEWQTQTYDWQLLKERLARGIPFPPDTEIHVIRHGETVLNALGKITGAQETDLTLDGKRQARILSGLLVKEYDMAFSSQLKRAVETLKIALKAGGVQVKAPMMVDPRLNERSLGVLEGHDRVHIPEYEAGDLTFAPPGGESYEKVAQRVLSFLVDLSDHLCGLESNPRPKRVLVCAHMGTMRMLVGINTGIVDPSSVLRQDFKNTALVVLRPKRGIHTPGFLLSTLNRTTIK